MVETHIFGSSKNTSDFNCGEEQVLIKKRTPKDEVKGDCINDILNQVTRRINLRLIMNKHQQHGSIARSYRGKDSVIIIIWGVEWKGVGNSP